MCGITGIVNCNNTSIIDKMTQRLAHRGPDNSDTFQFQNVHLGHTRLAIQDLSKEANQPILSDCGNYVIVLNGEIYNHNKIRKRLKTVDFKTTSDTETLLYAYKYFGKDCLNELNGIFAFCILDKLENKLFIARDRMGVKPLYYYIKDNLFAFSSEIKSFLEIPKFDKSINKQAIAHYIQYQYSPSEQTPFLKVSKLERATYLSYDLNDSSMNLHQYHHFQFDEEDNDLSRAKVELDNILDNSIENQHLSDVPIGYLLSGGLDSSAIVHYSKKYNSNLKAFTIDDENRNQSEGFESDLPYAQKIAKKYDVALTIAQPIHDIVENLDDIIYHLDEPIGDTSVLSLYQICDEVANNNIKVLLSGLGADDIFSGYRRHQALAYQRYKNALKIIPDELLSGNLRRRLDKFLGDIPSYYNWLSPNRVIALFNENIQSGLSSTSLIDKTWILNHDLSDLNRMLDIEQKFYLPHNNLLYTDKIGMAFGIEIRVPFLDNKMVEFANQISPNLKLNSLNTKYILRETLKNKLPKEILNRKKTGFGFPIREIIKNDTLGLINKYLLTGGFFNRNIFDRNAILNLIEDNRLSKIDASHSIWTLICIESWFRQFVD